MSLSWNRAGRRHIQTTTTKHVILFLAADPSRTDPRALDREAHAIQAELKRTGYRDRFEFVTRWGIEPMDLLRELRELMPTVVHFSGRGSQAGLFFQAADGRPQLVSSTAIAETFGVAGASVKLAVLSACYSEAPAEALLAHVDCVVGMGGSIHDDAARSFAIGFYGALGEHKSVAAAWQHGNAAISLVGLTDVERPRLKVRDGFDAAELVLAAVTPSVRVTRSCPYPGLRSYSADDADHFYGRDAEIDELLGRLRAGEREIYVIGPSGSGKSSLVAAGILPRLAHGTTGLGPFVVRTMRPGEHPAARLSELLEVPRGQLAAPASAVAALLAHRGPASSVLIVIDQLEGLFTLAGADERGQFLGALQALRTERRCVVIFALRADFFGAFMESPLWANRRGQTLRIEVGPLHGDALREAIAHPARDVGVLVEPALIERLLAHASSEPGILPLLQETLVQLWDRRQGQRLTLADYCALGDRHRSGLAVALARRADAALRELPPAQERIARRILLRLVSFGEGRSDTRRQQLCSTLRAVDDDAADFDLVLRQLIKDRLLTASDDDDNGDARIDLAHEVMIAAWPTLAGWIQTWRADEQRRRQLEAAAAQWVARGRGAGGMLDPIELVEAEAWQQTESARELGQSADVVELIATSRAIHDRHTNEVEASRKRAEADRRWAENSDRENQRLHARTYKEAGRQLVVEGRPQAAMPYLVAARQLGETGESIRMLMWTAAHSLPLVLPLEHQRPVRSATFSPDGTRIITMSIERGVQIWDIGTGKLLAASLQHRDRVESAAFSPDGSRVVTASFDNTARIWQAATGTLLTRLLLHQGRVVSAAFSPDGTRVVTASFDNTAQVWDSATGQPLAYPLMHRGSVWSAAFSPDGTRIVTASSDGTARIWNAVTGKMIVSLQHRDAVRDAAFSPDGTRVVTASFERTARVWDATGKLLTHSPEHQGRVWSAAFSPDGSRIVTASEDKTARIWEADTGAPLTLPLVHKGEVRNAVFSSDGARVITTSEDRTAQIWDAIKGEALPPQVEHHGMVVRAVSPDGTRFVTASPDNTACVWNTSITLITPLEHQERVRSAAFSPDGARIVTASGNAARVWDAATGRPSIRALRHEGAVRSAAFSPDGHRIVTASEDSTARIWDTSTGEPLTSSLVHESVVRSAAFSPDGCRIVTAAADRTACVWDVITGKRLGHPLVHRGRVSSAVFDPHGIYIVTASDDTTAQVWSAVTGKSLFPALRHQGPVKAAVFSPDGARVVTASDDGTARVWSAVAGDAITPPLEHQGAVTCATFSSDGARVVTASDDGTARVWDAVTGEAITANLEHQGAVRSVAFSPDGTRVVTASNDHTARVWDVATGKQLAPSFMHRGAVRSAAFSLDGTRVVTASEDHTARVWETRLDETAPSEWPALAERSPFVLSGGVHVLRASLTRGTGTKG